MKLIGHLINSRDPGGAEKVVLDICEHTPPTQDIGHVVIAFSDSWIELECHERGIHFLEIPYQQFWSVKTLPIWAFLFRRWLKKKEFDILHTHLYGSALRGGLAVLFSNIKHITT